LVNLDRGDLNANKDAITGTPAWEEDWSLDMTGNWTDYVQKTSGSTDLDQDRTHDKANEITEIDSSSTHVAHDKAGNMTKTPKPDNWSAHLDLTYDAWNRLVKVEDGEDTVAEYEYDGRNFRTVKRTYEGGQLAETRHFYYNGGWQCLEERLESGGQISGYADRQFVWGLRYIDALILRDRDTDANGTLDERTYALQDPNWNVVALAETDGDVAERYAYDAYGKPTVLTPAFASRATTSYAWETGYAGYRYDAEVQWYHVRNRILLTHLGRWNRRDPTGYGDGVNMYQNVHGRPKFSCDPMGLETVECTPIGGPIARSPWRFATVTIERCPRSSGGHNACSITAVRCHFVQTVTQRYNCPAKCCKGANKPFVLSVTWARTGSITLPTAVWGGEAMIGQRVEVPTRIRFRSSDGYIVFFRVLYRWTRPEDRQLSAGHCSAAAYDIPPDTGVPKVTCKVKK